MRKPREDPSPEAADLHKAALQKRIARERSEHSHDLFRDFLIAQQIQRDGERFAAQPTTPIPVDAIRRGLGLVDEPEQHGEEGVAA